VDGNPISNRNQKSVQLAIFAEAGACVRGLDPIKRQKHEDILCVNTCESLLQLNTISLKTIMFVRPVLPPV
jgi:hypothetical protein